MEKCPKCGCLCFEKDHDSETGFAPGHDHRYTMVCCDCGHHERFYDNSACECETPCGPIDDIDMMNEITKFDNLRAERLVAEGRCLCCEKKSEDGLQEGLCPLCADEAAFYESEDPIANGWVGRNGQP